VVRRSLAVVAVLFLFLAYIVYDDRPGPTMPGTVPQATPMPISITSPQAHRIFQRDDLDQADIPITGTYTGSPVAIEASFNGGLYQTIDASPAGGVFSGTLTNQDAGQGTLTVRFTDTPATNDTVDPINIGDVFFVIGQSNAEGNGDDNQVVTSDLSGSMWQIGGTAWLELADPTHLFGSPWPIVASYMMDNQDVPFGIVATAVGGTGLNNGEWLPGGTMYEQALVTLANSGVNGIKAMLWHQGEADVSAGGNKAAYQSNLSFMVDSFQADAPQLAGVKLVAAQIGDRNTAQRDNVDNIRLAIQDRWINDSDILAGPLTYDIDLNDGDGVHFGTGVDGQFEMETLANRWWRMLSYHFYGGSQGRAHRFAGATRSGVEVTVTFTGGVFPLTGQTDITGWRFTDNGVLINVLSATANGSNKVVLTLETVPVGIGLISFGSNEDAHGTLLKDSGTYPMPPEPFIDQSTTGAVAGDATDASYDATFAMYVDVEMADGTKLGSGPLQTVSRWSYAPRFDRAGTISCTFLASDPQAQYVVNRRYLRAWALLNGVWTEVGYGRVDNLEDSFDNDGRVVKNASGLDVTTELGDLTVGDLEIGAGSGATHAAAVNAIGTYAPDAWGFIPAESPANDYLYALFAGESVLGAFIHLAERTQTHFYRGSGRELIFTSDFEDSGIRAIQARGQLAAHTCAITSLRRSVDTHDYISRIITEGSGTGRDKLTLAVTTRTPPSGYTLNKTLSYIQDDAAWAADPKNFPIFAFKEITPISNTDADLIAAANMLYDAAFAELQRRASLADQYTYELAVTGCSRLLRPMQTIRVVYYDPDQGIDIDEDLLILEATWEVDSSGVRTSRLVVSTDDRWPDSDVQAAAERAVQGRIFVAHPQIGPTEWWSNKTLYVGSDQSEHLDKFPFVLSKRVTTVNQVVFRYKLEQLLSFATFVAGSAEFSIEGLAVTIDNSSIEMDIVVEGNVTLDPHTHPIPDHQHTTTVAGGDAGTALGYNSAGGFAFLTKAAAGNLALNSNVDSGATTSEGGGDGTADISATATGTGTGEGSGSGSGTVDLSDAIRVGYGLYRAPVSQTYDLTDLEMQVNGLGLDGDGEWDGAFWISLDEGVATGDYYEIDITGACANAELAFRPFQQNNLIEVRRKGGAGIIAITEINSDGTKAVISTSPDEHGLEVGDVVTISGTTNYDGTYVIAVSEALFFEVAHTYTGSEMGGTATVNKSAMILGLLGVATTIQALHYQ
jgi:hypothetical protein